MKKMQEYKALRIPYGQVAWYIGKVVSMVLSRPICCSATRDDYDYWGVKSLAGSFANAEIAKLIEFVKGDSIMCYNAIPKDTNFTKSLSMELCQALLRHALNLPWDAEFAEEDALWLMGQWENTATLPNGDGSTIFLAGRSVNTENLPSKSEVVQKLFSAGGTFSDLVNIYDWFQQHFGVDLYWHYPISDEYYSGSYLMLVQEGVLAISYNYVDECDHEIFSEDSARLLSSEEIGWFMQRWDQYSAQLQSGLGALYLFKTSQEEEDE